MDDTRSFRRGFIGLNTRGQEHVPGFGQALSLLASPIGAIGASITASIFILKQWDEKLSAASEAAHRIGEGSQGVDGLNLALAQMASHAAAFKTSLDQQKESVERLLGRVASN